MTGLRARILVAITSAVVLAAAAVGYVVVHPPESVAAGGTAELSLSRGGQLVVVADSHLATVAERDPSGPRQVSPVTCVRAYAAGGTAVCLRQDSAWTYSLRTLDARLRETRSFRIAGLPNRARVSASGRMVSWTAFISGESYNSGGFSTRTGVLDTVSGARVDSLEDFRVLRNGKPYRAVDVNYWGVTFTADDNRFYATLSTAGRRYLVEGDLAARSVRTLTENVECPSLSPDGTRIAFKQAIDGDPVKGWRLTVLDLVSQRRTVLAETRSIDDQPAWLDGSTIGYTFRDSSGEPSVWSTPADGSGRPQLLVAGAESPASL